MTLTFRKYNNKGWVALRPWAVIGTNGKWIKSFIHRRDAEYWLDQNAPGWRLAA